MTSLSAPVRFPKLCALFSGAGFLSSTLKKKRKREKEKKYTYRLENFKKMPKMAKGLLFRGQKNGGYCNIHKGINFNNSAKGCSCFVWLYKEATHTKDKGGEGEKGKQQSPEKPRRRPLCGLFPKPIPVVKPPKGWVCVFFGGGEAQLRPRIVLKRKAY